MVGRLLAMDLKEDGVIVSIIHPGFMKTEMTKGVGFDKFYEVRMQPSEDGMLPDSWPRKIFYSSLFSMIMLFSLEEQ